MNRPLAQAWGEFLSQFSWDWFLTLTFRDLVGSFRAHRIFGKFVHELEGAAGMPIFWFRADEIGPVGGRFHLHALMGNVAHLRRLTWMDRWSQLAGHARIESFDKRKGAAYYVAKYVTKQFGDWELSDNLRAFSEYQPILPLSGTVKSPALQPKSEPVAKIEKRNSRLIQTQSLLLPPNIGTSIQARHSRMIGEIYRSEVTRGRGRYREFFPNPERESDE